MLSIKSRDKTNQMYKKVTPSVTTANKAEKGVEMKEEKLNVYKKEIIVITKDDRTIHLDDTEEILFLIDKLKSLFLSVNKESKK